MCRVFAFAALLGVVCARRQQALILSRPGARTYGAVSTTAPRIPTSGPSFTQARRLKTRCHMLVPPSVDVDTLSLGHQTASSMTAPLLLAFADQGNNLAGKFFQGSLPPYLAFLYFLGYEKNRTPPQMVYAFQFLLLFVIATIPTGIISKTAFTSSLADVDWLHGGAEFLLTVSNVLLVLSLRSAIVEEDYIRGEPLSEVDPKVRYGTLSFVGVLTLGAVLGLKALHLEGHTPFLWGIGNLPEGVLGLQEPVNALSIPTWAVHFSSVAEFIFAMGLVWRLAETTGNEKWKGLAWGMLPSHASGVAACTYHFFYNAAALKFLVTLQAGLTALGNLTLAIAAFRIAQSNGWTVDEALPSFMKSAAVDDDDDAPALDEAIAVEEDAPVLGLASATSPFNFELPQGVLDLTARLGFAPPTPPPAPEPEVVEAAIVIPEIGSDLDFLKKLVGITVVGAYVTKYGELALGVPSFEPNGVVALIMVATPPAFIISSFIQRSEAEADGVDKLGMKDTIKGLLPSQGGSSMSMDDVKAFGVSGTVAYILTELAFWAVAFPVASTALYQTQGHWPDVVNNGGDRAAVLGFIFAGANAARLLVPVRFGAALALAPWVQENIIDRVSENPEEEGGL